MPHWYHVNRGLKWLSSLVGTIHLCLAILMVQW